MRCFMPRTGVAFDLRRSRDRWLEAAPHSFTLITIDGTAITARAMAIDDRGNAVPFGITPADSPGDRMPAVAVLEVPDSLAFPLLESSADSE